MLSYADKELTNSLVLASDWLSNISVVILLDKKRFREKRYKITGKIPLLKQILAWDWLTCLPIVLANSLKIF